MLHRRFNLLLKSSFEIHCLSCDKYLRSELERAGWMLWRLLYTRLLLLLRSLARAPRASFSGKAGYIILQFHSFTHLNYIIRTVSQSARTNKLVILRDSRFLGKPQFQYSFENLPGAMLDSEISFMLFTFLCSTDNARPAVRTGDGGLQMTCVRQKKNFTLGALQPASTWRWPENLFSYKWSEGLSYINIHVSLSPDPLVQESYTAGKPRISIF